MPTLLENLLAPNGPVEAALRDAGVPFEVRPQQAQMCHAVALAMQQKGHLLVEAGTGVGKSFAYLLPAALRCVLHGETCVVSTHTISLQEQLIDKDIPVIQRVIQRLQERNELPDAATPDGLPRPLVGVLVKGRGNYVSIRRLKLASERQDRLFADPAARRSLHVIEDWAYSTDDGTLSSLPPLERYGVWDKVQSDSGNCMGKKCPTYDRCFYQSARRTMEGANLLVCNHALFFSDLALRAQEAGFLPAYDQVVFDEAHTVEEVAGDHFGIDLSEGRVQHLLATLFQSRSGKGYLPQLQLAGSDTAGLHQALALVVRAGDATRAFFDDLLTTARRLAPGSPAPRRPTTPWTHSAPGDRAEPLVVRLREKGVVENALSPVMRELSLRLRSLRDEVKLDADRYELNAYAIRAELIAADAAALVEQTSAGCAHWIEATGSDGGAESAVGGGRQRVKLACAPIEVAPILKQRLFEQGPGIILTSATLATRSSARQGDQAAAFDHCARSLGCDGASTLQLGSPFDYTTQVRVYIERPAPPRQPDHQPDLPPPSAHFDQQIFDAFGGSTPPPAPRSARSFRAGGGFASSLVPPILTHLRATDGGAFVLFTSFATLRAVARELVDPLRALAMPLLVHAGNLPEAADNDGMITGSRTSILQQFRADRRSVLLGAMSFWQGVDVRGDGLRNVIITKLPFDPPDRPLVQARGEMIQSRGGNPFMEDALPRAILRFKQGFGRLIRSSTDRGRVVILDDRVISTRYGKLFLDALPKGTPIELPEDVL